MGLRQQAEGDAWKRTDVFDDVQYVDDGARKASRRRYSWTSWTMMTTRGEKAEAEDSEHDLRTHVLSSTLMRSHSNFDEEQLTESPVFSALSLPHITFPGIAGALGTWFCVIDWNVSERQSPPNVARIGTGTRIGNRNKARSRHFIIRSRIV
ncbi:hypothetical protein CVT25_014173 [Psilocybe cyanescens]|uniref:Uncharacterized protein n=1 Tax=Psilocybe cyanescens TaxID=93625 RepID=A0A409XUL4_PSICY|nr:hypothetical protein CVT25_014173 [Psilocybe cyanescens]